MYISLLLLLLSCKISPEQNNQLKRCSVKGNCGGGDCDDDYCGGVGGADYSSGGGSGDVYGRGSSSLSSW